MSDDLPMGWVETELGEIAQIVGGSTPKNSSDSSNFEQNGIPWITPSDLTGYEETYISRGRRDLSQKGFISCGTKKLPKGSVLFSSRAPIGYCVIAEDEVCTNQGFKSFVLFEGIISEFLRYYLITSKSYIESVASGTTFKEISASRIATVPFPLPPLNEQRRIVDKLERIGDRHRTARNELSHIPKLIARYKQAVLAAACSGKLTEDWREKNPNLETASELLKRISIEKDSHPSVLEKPWSLPITWTWAKLKTLVSILGDGLHGTPKYVDDTKYYFINGNNLVDEKIIVKPNTKAVSFDEVQKYRKPLSSNTVLVSINGTLGNVAFYNGEQVVLGKSVCYLNLLEEIDKYFIKLILISDYFTNYATQTATGSTIKNLSLKSMREFPIPIPSLEEQKEIVRRVEKMFEKIDMMEQEYQKAAKLCDRLEQATLAKAFRGELVPQDPDDEPASVLLEQVKSQRSKGKIKSSK